MKSIKIGTIKQASRPRTNFKNWVKNFWKEGREYKFKVIRIFLPSKFNNITLLLLDEENNLEISRTLNLEIGKKILKEFNLSIKRFNPVVLFMTIDKEGNQNIVSETSETEGYEFRNNYFVLTKQQDKIDFEEDLPL